MQDLHDLEVLIRTGVPIIVVETHEERRLLAMMERVQLRVAKVLFHWTVTSGLQRVGEGYKPQSHAREPREALGQVKATRTPGLYVLSDFHPYLDDPVHVRLLRDIAIAHDDVAHTIVLISHRLDVPPELERHAARLELAVPDRDEVEQLVIRQARRWAGARPGEHVRTSRDLLERLVDNLVGLPHGDVERLAQGAIADDGAITEDDLPQVMRAKFDLLGQDGVLSYEYDTAKFAEVGGLAELKKWLELRAPIFAGSEARPGLDVPKGVMLLGVQGCGKSLAAKAVAGAWSVPLLRLDFGTLYNKYYGESERNLRESLAQAELMAPCVLWIDEIEKGVSTDGGEGGVSRRILGTLLTWMAENDQRVFLVATANDIEQLPPELLRKGRLDEIFFVDLPDADTRRVIAEIHLERRGIGVADIDLDSVVESCAGFSGSEIEQMVVSALYSAYGRDAPVDTELLLEEVGRTRPLSVVMAERIAALRLWAAGRTVPAG